ncbi:MAG: hypothetical protein IPP90_14525 [Gemmatimonadaceae bacterium]|nr:hypothetical protein [Gemmatimonadaceae bacterium]
MRIDSIEDAAHGGLGAGADIANRVTLMDDRAMACAGELVKRLGVRIEFLRLGEVDVGGDASVEKSRESRIGLRIGCVRPAPGIFAGVH